MTQTTPSLIRMQDARPSPIPLIRFETYSQATINSQVSPLTIHHDGSEVSTVMKKDQRKAICIVAHHPDNAAAGIEILLENIRLR